MNGWERRNFLEIEINSFFLFWIKVIELYLERNKFLKLQRERDAFNEIINPFSPIFENVHVETIWTNDGARSRE